MTTIHQDFQERFAAILTEAKMEGLDINDVVSIDMLDHLTGVEVLTSQKKKISDLGKQLEHAQQNQEQLQIDLRQANGAVDFYKNLMKAAETRASQYQEKMKEILDKQTAAEEVDKKVARLERENQDLRHTKLMLAEEMRKLKEIHETLQDKSFATLEEKERKLMSLEKHLGEQQAKYNALLADNQAVEEQFSEVMTSLDDVVTDTTANLNAVTERARTDEQRQMATFSEIKPLRKFYAHANTILDMYRSVFKQLLNATDQDINISSGFSEALSTHLTMAATEIEAFHTLRAAFKVDGSHQGKHYEQLGELADLADTMRKNLTSIGEDVIQFLFALSRRPDLRAIIRYKFRKLR